MKILGFSITLLILLLGALTYAVFYSDKENVSPDLAERKVMNDDMVNIDLSGLSFKFRKSEVSKYPTKKNNQKSYFISLQYLLPNFETYVDTKIKYTPYNRLQINIGAHPNRIKSEKNIPFSYDFNHILKNRFNAKMPYSEEKRLPNIKNGIPDNNLFLYKSKAEDDNQIIYLDLKENPTIMLECSSESLPNPSCVYKAKLRDGFDIYYYYPKKFLYMAKEIHKFVINKVETAHQGEINNEQ